MNSTVEYILKNKIIVIVRGVDLKKLPDFAEALWRGGIKMMECTYDATGKIPDEDIASAIGGLVKQFEGRMIIGAGTVLRKNQVQLTKDAGGKFIISPDTNEEIIAETKKLQMVSIPGAFTASEATDADRAGADFVKLFPLAQLGVPYLKALCAPLSHIRFLAVGGVNSETIPEYLGGGACGVGMGLSGEDREAIDRNDFAFIEEKYRRITEKISGSES